MQSRCDAEKKVARNINDINAQARRWIVLGGDESLSAKERSKMRQWLAADPRNERAYRQARRVWDGIGQLSHLRGSVSVHDLKRYPFPEDERQDASRVNGGNARWVLQLLRRPAVLAPGLIAAASLVVAIIALQPGDPEFFEYGSGTGEIRDLELPDGTTVTLGARSYIRVRYSKTERAVWLNQGEAFFDARNELERPFTVDARYAAVRVMGTRFNVRRGVETVDIAVADGAVEVSNTREDATERRHATLVGGQKVAADRWGNLGPVMQVSLETVGGWRQGRFYYENTRLAEVVADVNRYSSRRILISPMSLGDMKISGSFSSGKADQILVQLQRILPIQVVEYGSDGLLVTSAATD